MAKKKPTDDEAPAQEERGAEVEKKEPERGTKARMIREALAAHPDEAPKDLAERLNQQAEREGLALTFTPLQVSAAKSAAGKKAGATPGGRGGRRKKEEAPLFDQPATPTPAAGVNGAGFADQVAALKGLVESLGRDQVKKLADLF